MFSLDISAMTGKAHVGYLRKQLVRAWGMLESPLREMSVALVGDRKMAELHERFMDIAGPTDVLTFELDHDAKGRVVAGEVVVCVPYAVREAKRRGAAVRKELLLYALHGMLHLCGLDDRNEVDFAHMHDREDDILKRLGVGAVFHLAGKRLGKGSEGVTRLHGETKKTLTPALSRSTGRRNKERSPQVCGSGLRQTCPRPPGRVVAKGGVVGAGEGMAPGPGVAHLDDFLREGRGGR